MAAAPLASEVLTPANEDPLPLTSPTSTSNTPTRTLRIGTRSSALALAQVSLFTSLLSTTSPNLPTTVLPTHTNLGDINKTTDLHTLASSGKSLWTEDLETELRAGRVDVIVHSLKDVPTQIHPDFRVAAFGRREESRDAVVMSEANVARGWRTLGDLPEGGVVGTSSVRRAAMVRRSYPRLVIRDVRGNVPTRIRKLDEEALGFDVLVLAGAGVQRLGMTQRISSWLGREEGVLHAVGQGALGVEWRTGDEWVAEVLGAVGKVREAKRVRWESVVERGLLRRLEGGCSVPVGVDCWWEEAKGQGRNGNPGGKVSGEKLEHVHSKDENDGFEADDAMPAVSTSTTGSSDSDGGVLTLCAMVVSLDGKECVEARRQAFVGSDREAEDCAMGMYAELVEKGAERILKAITMNRGMIKEHDGA